MFSHGQLYVALSRATCPDNLLCLVKPARRINGVPHAHNVVYSDFIVAATGHAPPTFNIDLTRATSNNNSPNGKTSDDDVNSNGSNNNHNQIHGSWSIMDETRDGACLLRCTARHVFNNPGLHNIAQHQLIEHISDHIQDVVAGSGGNPFHLLVALSTGLNEEFIKAFGCSQTQYQSVEHYLQLMANPTTFATH